MRVWTRRCITINLNQPVIDLSNFSMMFGLLTPVLVVLSTRSSSSCASMISLATSPSTGILFSKDFLHLAFHINQQAIKQSSHLFSCLLLSLSPIPHCLRSKYSIEAGIPQSSRCPIVSIQTCCTHWHPRIRCSLVSSSTYIGHVGAMGKPRRTKFDRTAMEFDTSFHRNIFTFSKVSVFHISSR